MNYFALDTSLTFKNGKVNPDHVYELFGNFNGLSGRGVHSHLLEYICKNIDFFDRRGSVCLPLRGLGLKSWVDNVEDSKVCCDELALLGLSAMYQRHTLVVTKNKFWSTIESNEPLSIIILMKKCSVCLLYLGNMKFGTLRWQPRNPQPVQPKPSLGKFNIVEEYTLDTQTTSGESPTAEKNGAEHVETNKTTQQVAMPGVTDAKEHSNQSSPAHEESSYTKEQIEPDSPVETTVGTDAANTPLLTTEPYPPDTVSYKEPMIKITRLSEADIDVWTNTVHKYYNFVPSHVEMDTNARNY